MVCGGGRIEVREADLLMEMGRVLWCLVSGRRSGELCFMVDLSMEAKVIFGYVNRDKDEFCCGFVNCWRWFCGGFFDGDIGVCCCSFVGERGGEVDFNEADFDEADFD